MNTLEKRVNELRAAEENANIIGVMYDLLFEDTIYELTVEDRVFGHNDLEEFCEAYACINMAGSWEDNVLNLGTDEEMAEITTEEAMITILEKEIAQQIENWEE